jgi:hypothetical protein
MIEEHVRLMGGAGRGLDADITRDEPSHIHLPRRRRTVRLDDRGNIVGRSARGGDEDLSPSTDR